MIEVIPSIIARNYEEFERLIRLIEPYTERVQLDIMDGIFVVNTTISGHEEVARIDTPVKFDVHLMVQNLPDRLEDWADPKADRFILHIESSFEHAELIDHLHNKDKKAGLAINPDTPLEMLDTFMDRIDFVQFMTVHPGAYGGDIVPHVLENIKKFHAKYPLMPIMVDGAMHTVTAKMAADAGASYIIVGGHLFFENREPGEALAELKAIVNNN